MGSNAKKITVNCGTTHVSVSVFSEKAGSLILEKLVVEDLVYDYTEETEWAAAASGALSSIFKSLKLKGDATVIAPGHLILTKNVRVPQVEASRQKLIIASEAAEKFPFPLAELVWDSQIISTDGVEAEAVLFAIKSDNAERFATQLVQAGITPKFVQPSTNLDYQAYRFLNGEATENVLIANVGARTTNLTFVTPDGFSIQNVAVGGNLLTQTIADSLGKPFSAAERLKVNYFSDSTDLSEDDPHVAKIRENAQAFCRRFCQEITRRIVNQKRQNPKGAPTKIFLTGRGSLLPGLSDALAETQRLPVEYFEPSVPVRVGAGVDSDYFDSVRFQLSEVIGDAAELLDSSFPQVNLLPRSIASGIAFSRQKKFYMAAAILLAIAPWPAFLGLKGVNASLEKESTAIKKVQKELSDRQWEITALQEASVPAAAFIETLDGVLASRGAWEGFLGDLQQRIGVLQTPSVNEDGEKTFPKDRHVWIESLGVKRGTTSTEDGKRAANVLVEIKLRMLIPEVDGAKPEHNSAAFNSRRKAILDTLGKSEFFSIKPGSDKSDFSRPNVPALTLTLIPKSEKGL